MHAFDDGLSALPAAAVDHDTYTSNVAFDVSGSLASSKKGLLTAQTVSTPKAAADNEFEFDAT